MAVVTFKHKGDFSKTDRFFNKIVEIVTGKSLFDRYGLRGVEALRMNTPRDSGETAESWSYKVEQKKDSTTISWYNTNTNDGVKIAILLQYGHATKNGGFVKGIDYINPSIQPVFQDMANEMWNEVKNA